MKNIAIPNTELTSSNIIMGCMRINTLSLKEIDTLVKTALDQGINFFDHANVYGGGECETLFSKAVGLTPAFREKLIIQSKCGIRKEETVYYDFSKENILESTDAILHRLNTDYLDVLLLHRPDTLVEPEEVAEAFEILHTSGKVKYFGVSNSNPNQIELLKKYVSRPIIFNQLQYSVVHTPLIDQGIAVNMAIDQSVDRAGQTLDYCRLNEITIQAWSPFQKGFFEGPFFQHPEYGDLTNALMKYGEKYGLDVTGAAVAWILRHPANMQVVLGTTKPERIIAAGKGSGVPMSRQEWYNIYQTAGNMIP
ncbi:aldo/keto reductase [Bacteroidia bacterium]|nr:aldo/keto reductase [Bacteroidia bacterium]GHT27382.1 aldo/keto reductase [Bacteroidia bacterium]